MKYAIKLSVFLGLVAAISTIALAAANYVTAPIIAEYQAMRFTEAVEGAFPGHYSFDIIATAAEGTTHSGYLVEVLEIFGEDNETLGFIYNKVVPGFGGPITYVMGIGTDGNFVSFDVLSHSETPGFGARVADEDEFENRLIGNYAGNQVDILTGATNTTTPIIRAIGDLYQDFLGRVN